MQRKNCRGRVDIDTWALESRVDLYTDGVRRRRDRVRSTDDPLLRPVCADLVGQERVSHGTATWLLHAASSRHDVCTDYTGVGTP